MFTNLAILGAPHCIPAESLQTRGLSPQAAAPIRPTGPGAASSTATMEAPVTGAGGAGTVEGDHDEQQKNGESTSKMEALTHKMSTKHVILCDSALIQPVEIGI